MFNKIRRKLASVTRKRTRDPEGFTRATPGFDSARDAFPWHDPWRRILPKERRSPPQPGIGARTDARVERLTITEQVSNLKLDSDVCKPPGAANRPPPKPKDDEIDDPQGLVRAQSNSHQQEVGESLVEDETVKFITFQARSQKLRALLLPPCTFQRTQALIHARQDLQAAEPELATTAAEMENLVVARSELEQQDGLEVPGAFFDDDAYADRERRQLLMATIEKEISFWRRKLEYLEAQRPQLEADLEALQEQFLDDLERAVRDDVAAKASVSKTGKSGKSAILWTE